MKIPQLGRAETKARILKGLSEVSKHLADCNDRDELSHEEYSELQGYVIAAVHEIE